MNLVTNLVFVF